VLRGVAVLGILLMNIGAFALPDSARMFPDSILNNSGLNFAIWAATQLTVAGVFRALFSMLFGASVLLYTLRGDERIPPGEVADLYYRRTLWLMAFGVVHAYVLLGWIDILFPYGLAGLFLFPFRRLTARWLALIGLLVLSVPLPLSIYATYGYYQERAAAARVVAVSAAGEAVSSDDSLLAARWRERVEQNAISPERQEAEIRTRQSGYWTNFRDVARRNAELQSIHLYRDLFWDVTGMMFLGMALFKWGVLSAERSRRFYLCLAVGGLVVGLAIRIQDLRFTLANGFDPFAISLAQSTYAVGRLLTALGYIGLVMLVCRSGRLTAVTRRLSAVGRMALTNYILQTVICTLLFYGVGFGLFGKLERKELLFVVVSIWIFETIASSQWLARFRFGPLEWMWRSLTHGSRQPLGIRINSP
jgi:uncharacterized protein